MRALHYCACMVETLFEVELDSVIELIRNHEIDFKGPCKESDGMSNASVGRKLMLRIL